MWKRKVNYPYDVEDLLQWARKRPNPEDLLTECSVDALMLLKSHVAKWNSIAIRRLSYFIKKPGTTIKMCDSWGESLFACLWNEWDAVMANLAGISLTNESICDLMKFCFSMHHFADALGGWGALLVGAG